MDLPSFAGGGESANTPRNLSAIFGGYTSSATDLEYYAQQRQKSPTTRTPPLKGITAATEKRKQRRESDALKESEKKEEKTSEKITRRRSYTSGMVLENSEVRPRGSKSRSANIANGDDKLLELSLEETEYHNQSFEDSNLPSPRSYSVGSKLPQISVTKREDKLKYNPTPARTESTPSTTDSTMTSRLPQPRSGLKSPGFASKAKKEVSPEKHNGFTLEELEQLGVEGLEDVDLLDYGEPEEDSHSAYNKENLPSRVNGHDSTNNKEFKRQDSGSKLPTAGGSRFGYRREGSQTKMTTKLSPEDMEVDEGVSVEENVPAETGSRFGFKREGSQGRIPAPKRLEKSDSVKQDTGESRFGFKREGSQSKIATPKKQEAEVEPMQQNRFGFQREGSQTKMTSPAPVDRDVYENGDGETPPTNKFGYKPEGSQSKIATPVRPEVKKEAEPASRFGFQREGSQTKLITPVPYESKKPASNGDVESPSRYGFQREGSQTKIGSPARVEKPAQEAADTTSPSKFGFPVQPKVTPPVASVSPYRVKPAATQESPSRFGFKRENSQTKITAPVQPEEVQKTAAVPDESPSRFGFKKGSSPVRTPSTGDPESVKQPEPMDIDDDFDEPLPPPPPSAYVASPPPSRLPQPGAVLTTKQEPSAIPPAAPISRLPQPGAKATEPSRTPPAVAPKPSRGLPTPGFKSGVASKSVDNTPAPTAPVTEAPESQSKLTKQPKREEPSRTKSPDENSIPTVGFSLRHSTSGVPKPARTLEPKQTTPQSPTEPQQPPASRLPTPGSIPKSDSASKPEKGSRLAQPGFTSGIPTEKKVETKQPTSKLPSPGFKATSSFGYKPTKKMSTGEKKDALQVSPTTERMSRGPTFYVADGQATGQAKEAALPDTRTVEKLDSPLEDLPDDKRDEMWEEIARNSATICEVAKDEEIIVYREPSQIPQHLNGYIKKSPVKKIEKTPTKAEPQTPPPASPAKVIDTPEKMEVEVRDKAPEETPSIQTKDRPTQDVKPVVQPPKSSEKLMAKVEPTSVELRNKTTKPVEKKTEAPVNNRATYLVEPAASQPASPKDPVPVVPVPASPPRAPASPKLTPSSPKLTTSSPKRAPASPPRLPASPQRKTASPQRTPVTPSYRPPPPPAQEVKKVEKPVEKPKEVTTSIVTKPPEPTSEVIKPVEEKKPSKFEAKNFTKPRYEPLKDESSPESDKTVEKVAEKKSIKKEHARKASNDSILQQLDDIMKECSNSLRDLKRGNSIDDEPLLDNTLTTSKSADRLSDMLKSKTPEPGIPASVSSPELKRHAEPERRETEPREETPAVEESVYEQPSEIELIPRAEEKRKSKKEKKKAKKESKKDKKKKKKKGAEEAVEAEVKEDEARIENPEFDQVDRESFIDVELDSIHSGDKPVIMSMEDLSKGGQCKCAGGKSACSIM